ncbi:MAG: hypothetical protein LBU14_01150 [Candidatus Peribacteria bacterium]|nr:hypothetical protein [Candidatus Peribacteria bacterium]
MLARFTNEVSEKELLDKLKEWNESANINGYIIQLPLPEHINTTKILSTIHPKKDVDGFHPNNQ